MGSPIVKCLPEPMVGQLSFCYDHEPGSTDVEPLDNPSSLWRTGGCGDHPQCGKTSDHRGPSPSLTGMGRYSHRFVDHDVVVCIGDEVQVLHHVCVHLSRVRFFVRVYGQ